MWDIAPLVPWRSQTFQRNMSPLSLGPEDFLLTTCFNAGFLLCIFFGPENGGDIFIWNVGWISEVYTVLYPRRLNCHNPCCESLNNPAWLSDLPDFPHSFWDNLGMELQCHTLLFIMAHQLPIVANEWTFSQFRINSTEIIIVPYAMTIQHQL